jgi:hypothetical protein
MKYIFYLCAGLWALLLLWDKFKKKPIPPTPQQLELERLELERRNKEIQEESLKITREALARRKEWRAKYSKYLKSPKWKRVRKRVLEEANYTCSICGGQARQVHHRRYPRGHKNGEFKRENFDYLTAICRKCHMKLHKR